MFRYVTQNCDKTNCISYAMENMGQAQYIPFKSANQFISHVKLYKNIYMPLERVDFFSFHKFDWIINFPLQCCQWVGIFKLYYMNMNKYFFFMSPSSLLLRHIVLWSGGNIWIECVFKPQLHPRTQLYIKWPHPLIAYCVDGYMQVQSQYIRKKRETLFIDFPRALQILFHDF